MHWNLHSEAQELSLISKHGIGTPIKVTCFQIHDRSGIGEAEPL